MSLDELLVTLIIGCYVFSAGGYGWTWLLHQRALTEVNNHMNTRVLRIEKILGIENGD